MRLKTNCLPKQANTIPRFFRYTIHSIKKISISSLKSIFLKPHLYFAPLLLASLIQLKSTSSYGAAAPLDEEIFTNFSNTDGLGSNIVSSVFVTDNGDIYAATYGGLSVKKQKNNPMIKSARKR